MKKKKEKSVRIWVWWRRSPVLLTVTESGQRFSSFDRKNGGWEQVRHEYYLTDNSIIHTSYTKTKMRIYKP